MERKFKIDFFELSFLAETCIPPTPIARALFWEHMITDYYFQMTKDERVRLFEWIQKNGKFNLDKDNCLLFYNRYNPDNQYKVHTNFKGKKQFVECFKQGDRYYTTKNVSVEPKYITKVEKI